MHEYFNNLKWSTYFSFIALIVVAIVCVFALVIFHNKSEPNDREISTQQSTINEHDKFTSLKKIDN